MTINLSWIAMFILEQGTIFNIEACDLIIGSIG